MPSTTNDPTNLSDEVLFTLANLALWAGDALDAESRFSAILQRHSATHGTVSVFGSTLVSSSQRALRQLRRRIAEYRQLGGAANLALNNMTSRAPLRSQGGHLSAIVWVESEREFELRCYLNDLSWESDFYKTAATRTDDSVALANATTLHYGSDEPAPSLTVQDATNESSLGLVWVRTIREMFLDVAVSDFCTLTARGIWMNAPPTSVDQITSVFQELLDEFDPHREQVI